jgi:phage baseplate assembly protein W
MAIFIQPFDLQSRIALGVDYPLMAGPGSQFKLNYLTIDQALANARNLLLTEQGERIMLPTFGCGLRTFLFQNNNNSSFEESIRERIIQQFSRWLPYITINTLNVVSVDNTVNISMSISIDTNANNTRDLAVTITTPQ